MHIELNSGTAWYALRQPPTQPSPDTFSPITMPAIACDACHETWSTIGFKYPSVAPGLIEDIVSRGPLSPGAFRERVATIRERVGRPELDIVPGTGFGPECGPLDAPPAFAPVLFYPWVLAAPTGYWDRIGGEIDVGARVPAEATWCGVTAGLEVIEVLPSVRLDPQWPLVKRCEVCGLERRQFVEDPDAFPPVGRRPRVLRTSLRSHIGRIREWPTTIVVSGMLGERLAEDSSGGIDLLPVDVI